MTWFLLVQATFSVICVLSVLHHFYLFFRRPVDFYLLNYQEHVAKTWKLLRPVYLLAVLGCVWRVLYLGGRDALAWMPANLFDNSSTSSGDMLALSITSLLAIGLLGAMSGHSEKVAKLEHEIAHLQKYVEEITSDSKREL